MKHESIGSGEALVLLGGGLTGSLSWIPHAESLAESYRVIRLQLHCVDLGLAGVRLPANYSVQYEVDGLARSMDELGIDQTDLAGWSYGAETCLSYAIHHPDRIRSLTLIEPPAYWILRSRGPLPQDLLDEEDFTRSLDVDDLSAEQLIAFLRFAGLVPEDLDPRSLPQWDSWYEHRNSLRSANAAYRHEDNIELLRRFRHPVLLVKGEGSDPRFHDMIDIMVETFPDARAVMYPGAHAAHLVSGQAFMQDFRRLLSAA